MAKDFKAFVESIKDSETYDKEELRGEIAEQIDYLMRTQGVSNVELARRLKTTRSYITKVLQGNANFTLDSLVQISRALGCKYVPLFVPVDAWREITAFHASATAESSITPADDSYIQALEAEAEVSDLP